MCHFYMPLLVFYTMPGGCRKGDNCRFMHGSEDTAAAQAPLPPPMSISMHPALLGQQPINAIRGPLAAERRSAHVG